MHHIFVLFNVHFVVFDEDYGALVLILTAVVWRTEDSNDRGEGLVTAPSVHFVSVDLDLVRSNHRNEVVRAQDLLHWVQTELHRAFTLRVGAESHLSSVTIVHRV